MDLHTVPHHETPAPPESQDAPSILIAAAEAIDNRAQERDHTDGERSMLRAVEMFNAWRGPGRQFGARALSEREGWVFMALLKLARAAGGRHRLDDYIDGAAYVALAGEASEREADRPF